MATTANGSAPPTRKDVPTGEIGSAADRDGVMFGVWDENEWLTPDGRVEVREIENMLELDGKARTLEAVLTLPLRSVPISLEPAKGDSGEAELAHDILFRPSNAGGMSTPIEQVVAQAVNACIHRRSFFERVFDIRDGRVVYDKIAFRPPASCSVAFDKNTGAFRGFKQYVGHDHTPKPDEQGKVHIRPDRALVFIHGQNRKPLDGVSDLSTAYNVFKTKQKIRFLWAQFLEEQVTPKTIAKDPNGQHVKLAQKVATLKGGGVIGIESDQSIDTLASDGSGASEFAEAMRYLDSEMAGSVLAGFTGLTDAASSGRGSYALSKDSTDFFLQSRQAVLDEQASVWTNFAVADIVRYNLGVRATVPRFKFGPMVQENIDQALELVKNLTGSQAFGSAFPDEFVDMLIEKIAAHFGMDTDRVAEALRGRRDEETDPTKKLMRGVAAGEQIVREANLQAAA